MKPECPICGLPNLKMDFNFACTVVYLTCDFCGLDKRIPLEEKETDLLKPVADKYGKIRKKIRNPAEDHLLQLFNAFDNVCWSKAGPLIKERTWITPTKK